ncbi:MULTISPECIES: endonuclease MutS2 [unclassified Coleofasciculus]|uniref:endonuclease MutS2 n=1 Tax=unclassified Coleofasciculus TaxID=2692782 RepID=UPI001880618A|nr:MULTISPECIES: endonuclease MutS2 [unclassified Coleofasciculus]MBE9126737.1 endonuclease MutS2 [Coleofasciculus sp. LEGE 07081]MBE9149038.1 endonuclease MutS2 [Coleofasciculus sp. LEGE 07092]
MIQSETLELLEWQRLCQHLATFSATKLGAIAVRNLHPPTTQAESLHLLAQTKEVYNLENRLISGLNFDGIQDIGDSLERSQLQGILSGEELLAIATTLAGARRLRRTIDDQEDVPVLSELVGDIRTYPELEQEIHRCIDDRGDVTDRASPKLGGLRIQIKSLRDRIYQILQGIVQRQSNALQQPLITQRSDRFVIPVKAPQKDAVPGIVHDASSSGATLYIEPKAIVGLGNQHKTYQRQEQAEEEAVRRALTEQVAAVKSDLEQVLAVATILDLATAKARYSLWLNANPPRFIDCNTEEIITLRELRHPLLIWQQQHEEGSPVVPINVQIQPEIRVVAITGPNTGGKTVTLKTLGLAALMAKAGLFVPAREPVELPWFNQILADIGDEQSLEQSLSTFSGHIRRISRILEAMGEESGVTSQESGEFLISNSLVLLDEVGAGTDPAEGSALAIALLRYLADHAQLTVATTHYGELKALKYEDERFENASVEFNDVTLSPTYRLLWGIPGRSNALTIARRLGLKSDVVDQAQTLVGAVSDDVNQVIAGLEAQRRRQETKATEATQLLQQAERLHEEVSNKAKLLQERERELKLSQERAVQDALTAAKAEIAQVIRQLQQGPQSAQKAQKATESLNEIAQHHLPAAPPPKQKPGFRPQVGNRVRIPRLNQTAEVLTAPDKEGELTVRFGIMKMTVSLTDVESLDGQKAEIPVKAKPAPPPTSPPSPPIRTSQNTVDIRGSRVADGEFELEQAISKATQSGALWIIHGKGTGRLRQGVHDFLERHPLVERFELAEQSEGGAGVTVAYLK